MSSESVVTVRERARVAREPRVRAPSAWWCGVVMLVVKVSLGVVGFERTLRWVRRTSGGAVVREDGDPELVDAAARAVAVAGAFYPGRALCLEQSLVLYWSLRRRGVGVELRLGVQPHPFEAHAWVEHEGRPILEDREKLKRFIPLPEIEQ